MSTLGVTFGSGFLQPIAESFARRFSLLNGIPAIALDPLDVPPLEDSAWAKAWIWDLVPKGVDCVIWFDADCIPIAPVMDLLPRYDYPFGAVQDMDDSITEALRHCPEAKKCRYYFNAGFFFARRVTRPLFEEWKALMDGDDNGFRDQTSLNLVLNRYYGEDDVLFLPPLVNWIGGFGRAPVDIRMLHLAGWRDPMRIQMLSAFMRVFDPVVKGVSPREEASCVGV